MLKEFDAIAICEVNDTQILDALEAILDGTGEDWEAVTSAKVGTTPNTAEHYGVVFKEGVFDLVSARELTDKKLADLALGVPDRDYSTLTVEPDRMFDREPYAVFLRTDDGRLDLVLERIWPFRSAVILPETASYCATPPSAAPDGSTSTFLASLGRLGLNT